MVHVGKNRKIYDMFTIRMRHEMNENKSDFIRKLYE